MKHESTIRRLLFLRHGCLVSVFLVIARKASAFRLATALITLFFIQSAVATPFTFTEVFWGLNGFKLTVPDLKVGQSNNNFTVSWFPDADYVLTTATSLSPSAQWTNAPSPLLNGSNMEVTVPIANAQQFFRLDGPRFYIPIFEFAIFYNSALEFTWSPPFTFNGNVHANGPIYTGVSGSSSLTFNSVVTTTDTISKKALGGFILANMTGPETFNGSPGYVTNGYPLLLFPGRTNNTPAALHAIVEIPPASEDVNSAMGQQRYYNKAGMVLLISNTTVTAVIKSSAVDVSPITITSITNNSTLNANFPFLTITNLFYDQRENKTNKVTQIDMFRLKYWVATNSNVLGKHPSDNPFGILYVADQRTVAASQLAVVRLVNGTNLPSSGIGFTVATPQPLYILGNYNVPVAADAGTTNTSHTVPASVVSDALTILSANWNDATSLTTTYHSSPPSFNAASTTINAAIMTGVVYSTGTNSSTFSGGVHNLTRLLENWTSDTLTLNTSIVNLYDSVYATNQYKLPDGGSNVGYYTAPTRQISMDQNFKDPAKLPPGTPLVGLFLPAN